MSVLHTFGVQFLLLAACYIIVGLSSRTRRVKVSWPLNLTIQSFILLLNTRPTAVSTDCDSCQQQQPSTIRVLDINNRRNCQCVYMRIYTRLFQTTHTHTHSYIRIYGIDFLEVYRNKIFFDSIIIVFRFILFSTFFFIIVIRNVFFPLISNEMKIIFYFFFFRYCTFSYVSFLRNFCRIFIRN